MDAIKYIEESRRMCSMFWGVCEKCPAKRGDECIIRRNALNVSADEQVKIVEEWSAVHPSKTRQSVFLEQWPEVDIDENGVVAIAPCNLLETYRKSELVAGKCGALEKKCDDCRREFWMQEVE